MAKEADAATRLMEAIKGFLNHSQNVAHVGDAWAKVFNINKSEKPRIYGMLAELLDQADIVESAIRSRTNLKPEKLLSSFPSMRKAFSPQNYNENPNEFRQLFGEPLLTQLDLCSDEMQKETVLEPATLDDIRASIDALFQSLKEADLSSYLRLALLDLVITMRRAVDQYEVRGLKGLKMAFGLMLAELASHHQEIKAKPDGPWKTALLSLANKFKSAIETGSNMATVIEFVPFASELLK